MNHGKIRESKTCLNCGQNVEERFCPHCGQENIASRYPFYYLFTHFFEDLTHYDGQLWGTIKNLLFRPGKLTQIYLEGKRKQFVPPVKLYIFVSFLTFFFISFQIADFNFVKDASIKVEYPKKDDQKTIIRNDLLYKQSKKTSVDHPSIEVVNNPLDSDEVTKKVNSKNDIDNDQSQNNSISKPYGYQSIDDFDAKEADNTLKYITFRPFIVKTFEMEEKGVSSNEITNLLFKTTILNLPKALFVYLPLFAFFLWIFHNKRKWWYFDHGVFTLHYFSFLLLLTLFLLVLNKLLNYFNETDFIMLIRVILITLTIIYSGCYFFIAHFKTYKTNAVKTILLGVILFIINYILFIFLLIGLVCISFLLMH